MNKEQHTAPFFLELVADYLKKHNGNDFSELTVIFPNKRAGLFLNEYLKGENICWSPRYMTISELFTSLSDVVLNNPIDTICRMYEIYVRLSGSEETLDNFYSWGERLLSDFDDIDKNLADARLLLQNVTDYKKIDFGDYLTEEQKKAISELFQTYDPNKSTALQENFFSLWQYLLPLYNELNKSMLEDGVAYEGALYRRVLRRLQDGKVAFPANTSKYIMVGFNVLDKVEEELFSFLQKEDRAIFFWDYDDYYVSENSICEAGTFIKSNLKKFPSPLEASCFRNLLTDKKIEFVESSSENAQAYSVSSWLKNFSSADPKKTVVVLCNEDILEAVLHALPDNVKEVNITKGYPYSHTPVFHAICKYLDEAVKNYIEQPNNDELLNKADGFVREYSKTLSEERPLTDEEFSLSHHEMMQQLYAEACFQAHSVIVTLQNIAATGRLLVSSMTLTKLLKQLLKLKSIPFHGEPVSGLQIMGVLETRCLDFENVLLLSANEGMIPKFSNDNSFIPYPLKAAYGLTLPHKKISVFSYYFYRLLQRAKHVRIMFNNLSDGRRTAEMSRFMTQMLASRQFNIRHFVLSDKINNSRSQTAALSIPKPENLYDLLNPLDGHSCNGVRKPLSPSAFNHYLDCPLKFYFSRIRRLRTPDPEPDDIQDNTFGNIFHKTAELYYNDCIKEGVTDNKTRNALYLRREDGIREYIWMAFEDLNINHDIVVEESVLGFMRNLLKRDAELEYLKVIQNEKQGIATIMAEIDGQERPFLVGGIIDRLDLVTNHLENNPDAKTTLRILDYKTGTQVHQAKNMEEVFSDEKHRPYYLFQTFLYALVISKQSKEICGSDIPVSAALFYPTKANKSDYDPWIQFGEEKLPLHVISKELLSEFQQHLEEKINELFDKSKPFVATPSESACKHCDFGNLCGVKITKG